MLPFEVLRFPNPLHQCPVPSLKGTRARPPHPCKRLPSQRPLPAARLYLAVASHCHLLAVGHSSTCFVSVDLRSSYFRVPFSVLGCS